MKKVVFQNKEYLKASDVAKKFKYTQDYVGQLCRSGKVDAKLVGRSWYVEPTSVTAYRKQKHAAQKKQSASATNQKSVTANQHEPIVKIQVGPVDRSKTLRLVKQQAKQAKYQARSLQSPVYEPEEVFELPISSSDSPDREQSQDSSSLTVRSAGLDEKHEPRKPTKKIKIKTSKRKQVTTFVSEQLPEIALSGKVSVQDGAAVEPESERDLDVVDKQRSTDAQKMMSAPESAKASTKDMDTKQSSEAVENHSKRTQRPSIHMHHDHPGAHNSRRRSAIVPLMAVICLAAIIGYVTVQSSFVVEVTTTDQANLLQEYVYKLNLFTS